MLNKLKKSQEKGFTIIEVIIVLAIAGLIILIVLLAVPALQRNGRNTAIKNDASAITSTISDYKSNNEGRVPTTVTIGADGAVTVSGGGGTTNAEGRVQAGTTGVAADPTVPGAIRVQFGVKCQNATSFATNVSARSAAVKYLIETSNGTAPRCVDA